MTRKTKGKIKQKTTTGSHTPVNENRVNCNLPMGPQPIVKKEQNIKFFPQLAAIILSLLVIFPSLFLPWSLIDNGADIIHVQKTDDLLAYSNYKEAFLSLFEPDFGRSRPLHWISNWAGVKFLGLDAGSHHAARAVLLVLTVLLLFNITLEISDSYIAALWAGMALLPPSEKITIAWGPRNP